MGFFENKYQPWCLFILFIVSSLSLLGQSDTTAHLRFIQQQEIDCDNNEVCFDLQIKADTTSFLFKAINLRMFYDFSELHVTSFEMLPNLNFYTESFIGDNPLDMNNELDFSDAHYYQHNLTGTDFEVLLVNVDTNWVSFAKMCFEVQNPPSAQQNHCVSLLYDLNEEGTGSLTGSNDGVVLSKLDEGLTLDLLEMPENLNWNFTSASSGIATQADCQIWTCGSACLTTVMNMDDSGLGSLRDAIVCAAPNDTIFFDLNLEGDTIRLQSEPLNINKNLVIFPDFSSPLVVCTSMGYVLNVDTAELSIHNMNLIGGTDVSGAIMKNNGTTHLTDVQLTAQEGFLTNGVLILNTGAVHFYGLNTILRYP